MSTGCRHMQIVIDRAMFRAVGPELQVTVTGHVDRPKAKGQVSDGGQWVERGMPSSADVSRLVSTRRPISISPQSAEYRGC
jgi:hypothetical protein